MEAPGDAVARSFCFFHLRAGAEEFHAQLCFLEQVVEFRAVPCVFALAAIDQVPEIGGVDQVQFWSGVGFEAADFCGFGKWEDLVMLIEQICSVFDGFRQRIDVAMGSYKLVRVAPSTFDFRCPIPHFL